MNKLIFTLVAACFASNAFGASIAETGQLKEYYVNFDDAGSVELTVEGEIYEAARPRALLAIKKINDSLYIVDMDNLYYPMVAIYPPLPVVQQQERATKIIPEASLVKVLVPVGLNVSVKAVSTPKPPMMCMAFWTGYTLNPTTHACERVSTSGCSNLFRYKTREACESGLKLD